MKYIQYLAYCPELVIRRVTGLNFVPPETTEWCLFWRILTLPVFICFACAIVPLLLFSYGIVKCVDYLFPLTGPLDKPRPDIFQRIAAWSWVVKLRAYRSPTIRVEVYYDDTH